MTPLSLCYYILSQHPEDTVSLWLIWDHNIVVTFSLPGQDGNLYLKSWSHCGEGEDGKVFDTPNPSYTLVCSKY